MTGIQQQLFQWRDEAYRAFQLPLMPTQAPETVIGVRMPQLRQYAKTLAKGEQRAAFLCELPHTYHEEMLLHVLLLSQEKDFDRLIAGTERVLPYIDSWAVCDTFSPKLFRKHTDELLPYIERWLTASHEYTVRFGIKMLMDFYLDEHFSPAYPARVAAVRHEGYYARMMKAWYFATALAKQYDTVIPYLAERRLDAWTHNKTIQKAVESYRIPDERKAYLKTLRR